MRALTALISGALFGIGLTLSQMVDPSKVLAFLNLTGNWDPSLMLVMGGGLTVAALGYRLRGGRVRPWFADAFKLPERRDLDARLLGGAALFGLGWGLAGYCPGPALASIALGSPEALIFLPAMLLGMAAAAFFDRQPARGTAASPNA